MHFHYVHFIQFLKSGSNICRVIAHSSVGKSNGNSKGQKLSSAEPSKKIVKAKHNKGSNAVKVSPKEEAILQAIGKLHAGGIQEPKRSMVQGMSKNSKTPEAFKKCLGAIKKKGLLLYPSGETIALTDEGISFVGVFDPESFTNANFHDEVIKELLSKKDRTIFEALVDGKVHDRKAVAEKLGYDMSKLSGYDKDLAKMGTLGYLDKTKTTLQLTDTCFPKGRPN